jgi:hypothetical protein
MRFAAPVHARQSVDVVHHNATPLASWIEKQR